LSAKRIKRKKRLKPKKLLKRLTLLSILVASAWLLFLAGRGTYRLAAAWLFSEPMIKTAEAVQVPDNSGISAQAVVLRQETVILADKPGRANLLVSEGTEVETGQRVLELVDKTLLASIEEELSKLDKQASQPSSSGVSRLAELDQRLQTSQTSLLSLMDDYRKALRNQQVEEYRSLYSSLNSAARELAKLQQDRLLLLQGHASVEEQRAELESRRNQAIVPVYSPANGRISFAVDGLEQVADLANLTPTLYDQLRQMKVADHSVTTDSLIVAGQPVFKVATDSKTYLLIDLPEGTAATIAEWAKVGVLVDLAGQTVDWEAGWEQNANLGQDQCLLQISPEQEQLLPRFIPVTLHTEGEVLCQIPSKALIVADQGAAVFVLDGDVVHQQAVVVRAEEKRSSIVTGLEPGMLVVTNPSGLADGADVSSRLRK
jgi:hypothetical protein